MDVCNALCIGSCINMRHAILRRFFNFTNLKLITMNTLQFYLDDVSVKAGYDNFKDLESCCKESTIHISNLLTVCDEAAELYAEESCKERRRLCAIDLGISKYTNGNEEIIGGHTCNGSTYVADKKTILNAPMAVNTEKL